MAGWQAGRSSGNPAIDLARGQVQHLATGKKFQARGATPMLRALQREGGLVPAIQRHGRAVFTNLAG